MIRTLLASTAAVLLSASVALAAGDRTKGQDQAKSDTATPPAASMPAVTPATTQGQGAPGSPGDATINAGKTSSDAHKK